MGVGRKTCRNLAQVIGKIRMPIKICSFELSSQCLSIATRLNFSNISSNPVQAGTEDVLAGVTECMYRMCTSQWEGEKRTCIQNVFCSIPALLKLECCLALEVGKHLLAMHFLPKVHVEQHTSSHVCRVQ
jgi:hypothetical protein